MAVQAAAAGRAVRATNPPAGDLVGERFERVGDRGAAKLIGQYDTSAAAANWVPHFAAKPAA